MVYWYFPDLEKRWFILSILVLILKSRSFYESIALMKQPLLDRLLTPYTMPRLFSAYMGEQAVTTGHTETSVTKHFFKQVHTILFWYLWFFM